ncbi:hypothetical protein VTO58DRAFT_110204 [Aureobasidium pullulans]|nr:hypothetical protein JADG_001083 [Aureobasidium pullulans]THY80405.1 hypothetical protein D6C95_09521 [Aureobasidium pullulans]
MGLVGGFCLGLLAIVLPPLACAARTGCDHHFIINIILTICGWIPGVLHAWYIILRFPDGKDAARRREAVRQGRAPVVQQGYGQPAAAQGVYYPPPPQQETGYRY